MNEVSHPSHYNQLPSCIECIDIIEHFSCCPANAIKYIWRAGLKGDAITDYKKTIWYLEREIERLEKEQVKKLLNELHNTWDKFADCYENEKDIIASNERTPEPLSA